MNQYLSVRAISATLLAVLLLMALWTGALAQTNTPTPQPTPAAATTGDTGLVPLMEISPEMQESAVQIVGLQGVLRAASGQTFDTYLVDAEGRSYGLIGQDATIEQQITALRRAGSAVRVWGTLYPQGEGRAVPIIVVSSIAATGTISPATPTRSPQQGVTAVVSFPSVNVRSGPDTAFPSIGVVTQGTQCSALGRNSNASWLNLQCPQVVGWVSAPLLTVTGNVINLPVIPTGPPPATATPTPPQFPQWKASYFTNRDLSGAAALVRNETDINFNWGYGSPSPGIPVDNFSARFERTVFFQAGTYNITTSPDDGVRVWINDELVIDDWRESSVRTLNATRFLSGNANVRIEYFEAWNLASLTFGYPLISSGVQPTPPPNVVELQPQQNMWAAAYWNNMTLGGSPVLARYENRQNTPLDQNWGNGSPAPGTVNSDQFSARFRGLFQFAAGDYNFWVRSDDGIRVWIDGIQIIDAWRDGNISANNTFRQLGGGWHTLTVEYYENTGTAFVQLGWSRIDGGGGGGGNTGPGGISRDD